MLITPLKVLITVLTKSPEPPSTIPSAGAGSWLLRHCRVALPGQNRRFGLGVPTVDDIYGLGFRA